MSRGPEGRRGGTAEQKAERLRFKAQRLSRQADAWVSGLEREPAVARKLSELPRNYILLRDLPIPGTDVHTDHLVIGPGGLYLVDAKKYSGKLLYSKKMLWHGRFPITEKLENVQWEAECLGEALGRTVVPVLCFNDAVLPQPVTTLGAVIVCRVSVLATVVRSTHATISPGEMERLLAVAGHLAGDDLTLDGEGAFESGPLDDVPFLDLDGRGPAVTVDSVPDVLGRPEKERRRRFGRPLLIALTTLVALALTAGVVWVISRWQEKQAATQDTAVTTTVAAPTTTTEKPASTSTTTTEPKVDETSGFRPSCPRVGAGWTMIPIWPGTFSGLAYYDYAVQNFVENTWDTLGYMMTPSPGNIRITGLDPGEKRIVRIVAALTNGTASEPRFVLVTAPDEPC